MRKILAISGGIDSMVLLHLFRDDPDVIVAHFHHGTRPSADADEQFVRAAAARCHKPFYSTHAHLGANVSEEKARHARYAFLTGLARTHDGQIYTAHHLDDLTESVAINLTRGTGWRGLCVLSHPAIARPFLYPDLLPDAPWDKKQIYRYAARHNLSHRQDPTNNEDIYLRNRLRQNAVNFTTPHELYQLWRQQQQLRHEIDRIVNGLIPTNLILPRSPFTQLDDSVALELLSAYLARHHLSATRPQLADFLHAIRTYRPGKKFNLPHDNFALISRDSVKVLGGQVSQG